MDFAWFGLAMVFDLQKASVWKRASAFLFDFILLTILVVAFALLLSWVTGYDGYSDTYYGRMTECEQMYGTSFGYTREQFDELDAKGQKAYMDAYNVLVSDENAMYAYRMMVNLIMLITSISIFLSYLVLDFIIPIVLKDGRTVGKKIFGIAVMRTNGVRMNKISLFIRTFLGKYAIETMVPVLIVTMVLFNTIGIVGPIVVGLILVLEVILMIATKTNSMIHDLLADTVVVDYASQMIYDSEEALVEAKRQAALDKANRTSY